MLVLIDITAVVANLIAITVRILQKIVVAQVVSGLILAASSVLDCVTVLMMIEKQDPRGTMR